MRQRSPRRAVTALAVCVVAVLALFYAVDPFAGALRDDGARRMSHAAESPAADGTMTEAVPVEPESLRIEATSVGRGGTLAGALARVGISGTLRNVVLVAVGEHTDLNRLSPRTGVTVSYSPTHSPRLVSVRAEPERFVRVHIDDSGNGVLSSELRRLSLIESIERTGGVIRSSVAAALAGSSHSVQLTNAFAAMFQWDVDLLVDPRPGDRFRIVYEALRLGDVPDDLPAYGNAPHSEGDFVRVGQILAASYDGAMARSSGYWVEGANGSGSHYDVEGRPLRKAFLKSPLNYRRISSGFSNARRNPVTRRVVPHHGVDFAAATGTPVVATAEGRVFFTGWAGPLGRAIRIRHGSSWVTVYGHLSGFAPGIRNGVEVSQNQLIGYVGATGRATGPHLHYTLISQGRPINPMTFDNPPAEELPDSERPRLASARRRWAPLLESIVTDTEYVAGTRTTDISRRAGS